MNGFALSLALNQRLQANQKCPIVFGTDLT